MVIVTSQKSYFYSTEQPEIFENVNKKMSRIHKVWQLCCLNAYTVVALSSEWAVTYVYAADSMKKLMVSELH